MGQRLLQGDALVRILDQQFRDQVLTLLRVVRPLGRVEDHLILARHPDRLLLRVVVERQRAAQKCVDDAAERPKIARPRIGLLL